MPARPPHHPGQLPSDGKKTASLSRAKRCLPGSRGRSRPRECTPHRAMRTLHRPHTRPCRGTSWRRRRIRLGDDRPPGNDGYCPPTAQDRTYRSWNRMMGSPSVRRGDRGRPRCRMCHCPTGPLHPPACSDCWTSMQPTATSLQETVRAISLCLACRAWGDYPSTAQPTQSPAHATPTHVRVAGTAAGQRPHRRASRQAAAQAFRPTRVCGNASSASGSARLPQTAASYVN